VMTNQQGSRRRSSLPASDTNSTEAGSSPSPEPHQMTPRPSRQCSCAAAHNPDYGDSSVSYHRHPPNIWRKFWRIATNTMRLSFGGTAKRSDWPNCISRDCGPVIWLLLSRIPFNDKALEQPPLSCSCVVPANSGFEVSARTCNSRTPTRSMGCDEWERHPRAGHMTSCISR